MNVGQSKFRAFALILENCQESIKTNFVSRQELREEFERESSKTGRPRLLLSMAVPAGIEYIDKGYDIPRLNEYLDFINLLSYDYHSAYEPAVNHHSPLYPLEEDNEYNYDAELTIVRTYLFVQCNIVWRTDQSDAMRAS